MILQYYDHDCGHNHDQRCDQENFEALTMIQPYYCLAKKNDARLWSTFQLGYSSWVRLFKLGAFMEEAYF